MEKHPEQRLSEVFYANVASRRIFKHLNFKTKRLGKVAYLNGRSRKYDGQPGPFPVFLSEDEFRENGFSPRERIVYCGYAIQELIYNHLSCLNWMGNSKNGCFAGIAIGTWCLSLREHNKTDKKCRIIVEEDVFGSKKFTVEGYAAESIRYALLCDIRNEASIVSHYLKKRPPRRPIDGFYSLYTVTVEML